MTNNLPVPTPHAEPIAKLATGVGTALAAIWFPPAALAQPIIDRLIERYVKKPQRILIEVVRENGVEVVDDDKFEEFVPMAYKFYEAAKQGEFERNLRILSEFIANEMKQPVADAGSFARMSRRLESISETELQVILLTHDTLQEVKNSLDLRKDPDAKEYAESDFLAKSRFNKFKLSSWTIRVALAELASRGFLIPTGHAGFDKAEEHYYATSALEELVRKASKNLVSTVELFPADKQAC